MLDQVNPIQSSFLTGRIGRPEAGANLQLVVDGKAQPPVPFGLDRAFSIPLPAFVFDGAAHEIRARIAGRKDWLPGCPLHFQSQYQGYVNMEPFAGALMKGWAIDLARPTTVLGIEILLHYRPIAVVPANIFREDLQVVPPFTGACGFTYRIEGQPELDQSSIIQARIHGTHFDLHGSPVLYLDTSRFLKTLHSVNGAFRFLGERTLGSGRPAGPGIELSNEDRETFLNLFLAGGNLAELMEISRWFQATGEQHTVAESHRHRFYTYLSESFAGASAIRNPAVRHPCPEVIVYIDSATELITECLRRLLASPAEPPFTVICVLESGVPASLVPTGANHPVTTLKNPGRLGFAASVNRAMKLHTESDVVLLDARTIVSGNWLEPLFRAANHAPAAGIVTAFATDGEVCCYRAGTDPAILLETYSLSDLCAEVNQHRLVDLPAVHGVCTYIRRACLDEVGLLTTSSLSSPRAVMIDFSSRAAAVGWRVLLAAGTLVDSPPQAPGTVEDKQELERRHPQFGDLFVNFNVDDPALVCRRDLDWAVLRTLKRPVFCFLTHRFGGGTERHVRDLCTALDQAGIESLVIFALDSGRVTVSIPRLPGLASLHYKLELEFEDLVGNLSQLKIQRFHIHSNIAIPAGLFTLPRRLGVEYDCTIHDYSWFCPRVNLIDESGLYCGEPPATVCDDCVRAEGPGLWREFPSTFQNVAELRENSRQLLSGAERVFCPSRDTMLRMERQLKLTNLVVRGNLEPDAPAAGSLFPAGGLGQPGVALIGFITRKKGMDVLLDCARAAQRDGLPLRFVVVGFTEDDHAFDGLTNVLITGRYKEGEADSLIRSHALNLAFFPIIWPETYSYTLSIALNCGLFPLAFDLGAISERIRELKYGHLLPIDTPAEEINAALVECGRLQWMRPKLNPTPALPDVMEHYYSTIALGPNGAESHR